MPEHSNTRASDADRVQIVEHLRRASDEGRLLAHEYDERVGHALNARTYGELDEIVADLPPRTGLGGVPRSRAPSPPSGDHRDHRGRNHRGRGLACVANRHGRHDLATLGTSSSCFDPYRYRRPARNLPDDGHDGRCKPAATRLVLHDDCHPMSRGERIPALRSRPRYCPVARWWYSVAGPTPKVFATALIDWSPG